MKRRNDMAKNHRLEEVGQELQHLDCDISWDETACGHEEAVQSQDETVCGQDKTVCGQDETVCGQDETVCGQDETVCGQDETVCAQDTYSQAEKRHAREVQKKRNKRIKESNRMLLGLFAGICWFLFSYSCARLFQNYMVQKKKKRRVIRWGKSRKKRGK